MNHHHKKILVIGASSAIASSLSQIYAAKGASFFLVGRSDKKLSVVKNDLISRGALKIDIKIQDFSNPCSYDEMIKKADLALGGLDIALLAHGVMVDQSQCERNFELFKESFQINFMSLAGLSLSLTNYFEGKKSGSLVILSSVAGDRGRQSNYIYGTAKAALNCLAQGLRNRSAKHKVHILTVKPGFVDTPMTQDYKKNFLFSKPEKVASLIFKGIEKKKEILYVPFFWYFIMLIIKAIPEKLFKNLNL